MLYSYDVWSVEGEDLGVVVGRDEPLEPGETVKVAGADRVVVRIEGEPYVDDAGQLRLTKLIVK